MSEEKLNYFIESEMVRLSEDTTLNELPKHEQINELTKIAVMIHNFKERVSVYGINT